MLPDQHIWDTSSPIPRDGKDREQQLLTSTTSHRCCGARKFLLIFLPLVQKSEGRAICERWHLHQPKSQALSPGKPWACPGCIYALQHVMGCTGRLAGNEEHLQAFRRM